METEIKGTEQKRGRTKSRVGVVVSSKMDKTIVVAITRKIMHPLYKKTVKKTKKFYAHDESKQCQEGDIVEIKETKPLSRTKRWRVSKILEKAK